MTIQTWMKAVLPTGNDGLGKLEVWGNRLNNLVHFEIVKDYAMLEKIVGFAIVDRVISAVEGVANIAVTNQIRRTGSRCRDGGCRNSSA